MSIDDLDNRTVKKIYSRIYCSYGRDCIISVILNNIGTIILDEIEEEIISFLFEVTVRNILTFIS